MLTCEQCRAEFPFKKNFKANAPARYCSKRCAAKAGYLRRTEGIRQRREFLTPEERARRKAESERRYWARPENRSRRNARMRLRYASEEYKAWARERWRRLFGDQFAGTSIPEPYHGHPWLDMARQAVNGGRDVDPAFRDFGYDDEMGEALLALLEGRDMDEAVKEFRRKEFIPRHMTMWLGDWKDGDDDRHRDDRVMPSAPSAEEEVIVRETTMSLFQSGRYDKGSNRRRFGNNRGQQQPSRRRMKDKSLRSHRRAA